MSRRSPSSSPLDPRLAYAISPGLRAQFMDSERSRTRTARPQNPMLPNRRRPVPRPQNPMPPNMRRPAPTQQPRGRPAPTQQPRGRPAPTQQQPVRGNGRLAQMLEANYLTNYAKAEHGYLLPANQKRELSLKLQRAYDQIKRLKPHTSVPPPASWNRSRVSQDLMARGQRLRGYRSR